MVEFGQQAGLLLKVAAHVVVGLLFERLDGHDRQRFALDQVGRFGLPFQRPKPIHLIEVIVFLRSKKKSTWKTRPKAPWPRSLM